MQVHNSRQKMLMIQMYLGSRAERHILREKTVDEGAERLEALELPELAEALVSLINDCHFC